MDFQPPTLLARTPDTAPFLDAGLRGELCIQQCGACGRLRHPPGPRCPSCRSSQVEWTVVSGRGTIWSFVVAHPPLLPAFAELAPYNVIIVALAEDPTVRVTGNLVPAVGGSPSEIDPSTILIDEAVRAVFLHYEGESHLQWVRD